MLHSHFTGIFAFPSCCFQLWPSRALFDLSTLPPVCQGHGRTWEKQNQDGTMGMAILLPANLDKDFKKVTTRLPGVEKDHVDQKNLWSTLLSKAVKEVPWQSTLMAWNSLTGKASNKAFCSCFQLWWEKCASYLPNHAWMNECMKKGEAAQNIQRRFIWFSSSVSHLFKSSTNWGTLAT